MSNPELGIKQFDQGLEITMVKHSAKDIFEVWQVRNNIDFHLSDKGEVLKITIWVFKR